MSLSPSKQVLIALGAVGIAGWCAYATVNVMMRGQIMSAQNEEIDRLEQKYQRWLQESRARELAAQQQLEEKSAAFERATAEFERRHETLKLLLDYAGGSGFGGSRMVERDGAKLLMQASVEEADPRQSRDWIEGYEVQNVSFRASADTRIERLSVEQAEFLAATEEAALRRSEEVQGVLKMTGVGFRRLLDEGGVGGPEVPEPIAVSLSDETNLDPAFARRVKQVAARVAEARKLEAIARATPLGPPVAVEARETSGFGYRIDPFTGRPNMHAGLDLAAFERAPVVATSAGIVSFAGVRQGYGNTVEVDHGHGFKTRYGHLRDIQVKSGDPVAIGQRVGSMGSTGRSTGTHLHYEVWYRGKAYDPKDFLRAGRHVHEQG